MDKYLNAFSEELCAHFEPEALFPVKKNVIVEWFRYPFVGRKSGKKKLLISDIINRLAISIFTLTVYLIVLSVLAVTYYTAKKGSPSKSANNAGTCITGYYSIRRRVKSMIYKTKVAMTSKRMNYVSKNNFK